MHHATRRRRHATYRIYCLNRISESFTTAILFVFVPLELTNIQHPISRQAAATAAAARKRRPWKPKGPNNLKSPIVCVAIHQAYPTPKVQYNNAVIRIRFEMGSSIDSRTSYDLCFLCGVSAITRVAVCSLSPCDPGKSPPIPSHPEIECPTAQIVI